jgi:hypothetical protein
MPAIQHGERICLYHSALLPRVLPALDNRHRTPGPAAEDLHRGERESVALDVFDGSIRRAEALTAHLHRNDYDISEISGRIRALRSLRGDLAFAFKGRHADLLERLRSDIPVQFEGLVEAFRSLEQDPRWRHTTQCRNLSDGGGGTAPSLPAGPIHCQHAMTQHQHA